MMERVAWSVTIDTYIQRDAQETTIFATVLNYRQSGNLTLYFTFTVGNASWELAEVALISEYK